MGDTCYACGQSITKANSSFEDSLRTVCDAEVSYYDGWDAVWARWRVGDWKIVDGKVVTKVFETDEDELDGYGDVDIQMVFEDEVMQCWKLKGSWSSYGGKKWEDGLVKVEKKERTSVYYG
jgi:hypothetical protein